MMRRQVGRLTGRGIKGVSKRFPDQEGLDLDSSALASGAGAAARLLLSLAFSRSRCVRDIRERFPRSLAAPRAAASNLERVWVEPAFSVRHCSAAPFAAVAFRFQFITSLRFVALRPCAILLRSGAHVLNGLADLIRAGRLHLGAARWIHAGPAIICGDRHLVFAVRAVLRASPAHPEATVCVVPLWQQIVARNSCSRGIRQIPLECL